MQINEVSGVIVDAAYEIHKTLGPGLLESAYSIILAHELARRGLKVQREVEVPITWRGVRVEVGFRADLVVEDSVVVELKSVEELASVHSKQLLTYLRLMDRRVGLLINFGAALIKDGIVRVANGVAD